MHKKETLESERAACSRLETDAAELASSDTAATAAAAQQEREAAAAALEAAEKAVKAAQCELAGAEAGDGRDESNRSMQERLADTRNEQVSLTQAQHACMHAAQRSGGRGLLFIAAFLRFCCPQSWTGFFPCILSARLALHRHLLCPVSSRLASWG